LSQLLWCWRRLKTLVEAASDWDLSHRLAVKGESTKVPSERHGWNPGFHGRKDVNSLAG